MKQMYKVFINDAPIILTTSALPSENLLTKAFDESKIVSWTEDLSKNKTDGLCLLSKNISRDWKMLQSNFEVISAAGGLVINEKEEILLIYRNNKWDLPKGKLESNESAEQGAIREVEEECGITKLSIIKKINTTYHIYNYKGLKLKETHWFLMTCKDQKTLVPQIEEGITDVVFKNKKEAENLIDRSYANIKLVYKKACL